MIASVTYQEIGKITSKEKKIRSSCYSLTYGPHDGGILLCHA